MHEFNRHVYAMANPVMFSDPIGLMTLISYAKQQISAFGYKKALQQMLFKPFAEGAIASFLGFAIGTLVTNFVKSFLISWRTGQNILYVLRPQLMKTISSSAYQLNFVLSLVSGEVTNVFNANKVKMFDDVLRPHMKPIVHMQDGADKILAARWLYNSMTSAMSNMLAMNRIFAFVTNGLAIVVNALFGDDYKSGNFIRDAIELIGDIGIGVVGAIATARTNKSLAVGELSKVANSSWSIGGKFTLSGGIIFSGIVSGVISSTTGLVDELPGG